MVCKVETKLFWGLVWSSSTSMRSHVTCHLLKGKEIVIFWPPYIPIQLIFFFLRSLIRSSFLSPASAVATIKNVSRHCHVSCGGTKSPPVENYWLRSIQLPLLPVLLLGWGTLLTKMQSTNPADSPLDQGCQTHFHWGPHQPRGCLRRAKIILGLYKCNYCLTVKE